MERIVSSIWRRPSLRVKVPSFDLTHTGSGENFFDEDNSCDKNLEASSVCPSSSDRLIAGCFVGVCDRYT